MVEPLRSRFHLVLELVSLESGEVYRTDVVQAVLNFQLNQIPTAECQLPLGRVASDGKKTALVHRKPELFQTMTPARLYLVAEGQYSEVSEWPEEEVLIFDGYVTHSSSSMGQGATFSLLLTDKLLDLHLFSSLSGLFYPSNLIDFAFSATFLQFVTLGGNPALIADVAWANDLLLRFDTDRDVWSKLIKPLMYGLVENDNLRTSSEIEACLGGPVLWMDHRRRTTLEQIRRIEGIPPEGFGKGDDAPLSPWNPGCRLDLREEDRVVKAVSDSVVGNITKIVTHIAIEELSTSTLWERLIMSLLPQLALQFVPRVRTHMVVPSNPFYRYTWSKKILASDYVLLQPSNPVARSLAAVAVVYALGSKTGLAPDAGEPHGDGWICYRPEAKERDPRSGAILTVAPPPWLASLAISDLDVTADPTGTRPVSSLDPPGSASGKKDPVMPADFLVGTSALFRRYARYVYHQEKLRGRTLTVSGKLRFDIAPGSIVFVEVPPGRLLEGVEKSASLVGQVLQATIAINAESAQAGTGFNLGFVRTERQNEEDTFSAEEHPLYLKPFVGSPIVEEYHFAEESD